MDALEFLYIGLGSFSDTSWYGTQRYALALSSIGRVLFVERPVTLFEALRGRKSKKLLFHPLRRHSRSLWLFSPPYPVPFGNRPGPSEQVNRLLNILLIRSAARRIGFRNPILWLDDPFQAHLLGKFSERLRVYNCLHEYAFQPNRLRPDLGYERGPDGTNLYNLRFERKVLRNCDLVVCETASRAARKRRYHPRVSVVPHGVDFEFYRKAAADPRIPDDLQRVPRPRIGFAGTLNAEKVDFSLLEFLARERPQWSFVLVGRIYRGTSVPDTLRALPNVHLLGEKSYAEVPHYLKAFDVCMIPYLKTPVTDDIQTVKVYEYLAAGKPVVSTSLDQLRGLGLDVVLFANDPESFLRSLEKALELGRDGEFVDRCLTVARQNSWTARARVIEKLVRDALSEAG